MAITNTTQAKNFAAGAPRITLRGDLRPLNTMAYGGRAEYGLGSIVKSVGKAVKGAVKGVARGVKKVAKSPLGKAALLAGFGMYAGGLGPFANFGRGAGFASNLFSGMSPKLKGTLTSFAVGSSARPILKG